MKTITHVFFTVAYAKKSMRFQVKTSPCKRGLSGLPHFYAMPSCSVSMATPYLDNNVPLLVGVLVEVDNLGAEPGGHLVVHLPAGVHQVFGQRHVAVVESVVNAQRKHTRKKAYQMVLEENTKWLKTKRGGRKKEREREREGERQKRGTKRINWRRTKKERESYITNCITSPTKKIK